MNSSNIEPSSNPEQDWAERVLPLLPEIGKLLYAAVQRHPHAAGLSLGQIKATGWLAIHGRRAVGEIAAGLGVSLPTASELVESLVQRGLVERGPNPADRRQVLVWLTPEAAHFKREMRALRTAQVRAAMEQLAPEERPVFVRSLEALVEALRRDPDELVARWSTEPPTRDHDAAAPNASKQSDSARTDRGQPEEPLVTPNGAEARRSRS